jgi:hypothetical protein
MEIGSSYHLRSVHSGIRGRGRGFGQGNNSWKDLWQPSKRARREWIPHIVTTPSRGPIWFDGARENGFDKDLSKPIRGSQLNAKNRGRGLRVEPS